MKLLHVLLIFIVSIILSSCAFPSFVTKNPNKVNEVGCLPLYGDHWQADYGLALSGGGYRAMLYHAGAILRLYELGLLEKMDVVSSVSGGSIAAAWLGLKWKEVFPKGGNQNIEVTGNVLKSHEEIKRFKELVIEPLLELADKNIDYWAGINGILSVGTIAEHVAKKYDNYLFKKAKLDDLPKYVERHLEGPQETSKKDRFDAPRFVILSTNLKTHTLVKFTSTCLFHYPVGQISHPDINLATAVAASSAFPPFLSPLELKIQKGIVDNLRGQSRRKSYHSKYYGNENLRYSFSLSDGGVYDNLGIEELSKQGKICSRRFREKTGKKTGCKESEKVDGQLVEHVFVSDGGGRYLPQEKITNFWLLQTVDVLNSIDRQVRSLRKEEMKELTSRKGDIPGGANWSIWRSLRKGHNLSNDFNSKLTCFLAETKTRLANIMTKQHQKMLVNWGYVSTDSSVNDQYFKEISKLEFKSLPFSKALDQIGDELASHNCE